MYIIKIGGGKTINHKAIIKSLKLLDNKVIVVHGANSLRDEIAQRLGIPVKTIISLKGYSSVRSDKKLMDLFLMSYAGLRNKRLVEIAQQAGINAIGLTGLDGALIRGKRNKKILSKEGDKIKVIKDDYSGRPKEIKADLLKILLNKGLTPFICPPILNEENEALNSENDSIVSLLVKDLSKVKTIIHFIEAPGLLKDHQDEKSLISKISLKELKEAEDKYTKGRMKRKM
jgi:acetylglutamate/LysW-gamma-L-alpha-aminoadipate kinase